MSEMVSAAIESEKKPLNLSQVSPKAQQEAFGFALANPNPTPPPSSGAGDTVSGELPLNEIAPPSSIALGDGNSLPPVQSPVSMAPPTMPMGMNNSLASAPQKQTSELAKILGNKEMSQLEKMSRLHSNNTVSYSGANPTSSPMAQMIGSPNQMHHPNASMSPTSGIPMTRPNGQGVMSQPGMMPGMHPGGPSFGGHPGAPQFGNFAPNHPGMMGQANNFRFPMRHPVPGFGAPDQSQITSPASTPPVVEPPKPSAKRNRRPSRKNSRDGAEEEGRAKKQRKTKEPGEGPPKRKRPPKKTANGGVLEGTMYMFSSEMLNDAAKGLDTPKANLVQYHQSKYTGNQPQRIQPKITPNTTPPVPSASQLGHMPGHQRPMPHHRMSPGMNSHMGNPMSPMNPGGMSPGMGNHVMSPLGPHRVPTPQQDGRPITPGSTSSRMGIGQPPASPALSQDARIPQSPLAPVPSPYAAQSTTPTPATPTPVDGPPSQQPPSAVTPQMTPTTEEVKLKEPSAPGTPGNSTPTTFPTSQNSNPETNTMDTLREIQSEKKELNPEAQQNNHHTPGNPSIPRSVHQARPENHDLIQNMIDQQKMNPLQQPLASMQQQVHQQPQHPQHPAHHQQPRHGHPGMHHSMHPGMHRYPYNGHGPPGGYHPGMPRPNGQIPYNAHMMHQMRQMHQMQRLPYGHNHMMRPQMMRHAFPNRGMMPNSNQMPYSEQLRQQAAMYSTPQQGPPGMNFGANQNGPQSTANPYNTPQENGGFGSHPQGMQNPGQVPNGVGINNYPSSYSPSAQHQGQPRGMMSPSPITQNAHMGQAGPQATPMNIPGQPGTPSAPLNPAIDSPYPNNARSPANSLVNGPIHSPSPSQGGTPSIPPSVPEMHPSTPQGMPLSPAHTNPMTPVSVPPQAPHTPGAPMTPGDPASFAGTPIQAPHTPGGTAVSHGQPMTPGNPATPAENLDNNGTPVVSQMMPCSPMTPQGQQGPFSPHNHPPNGLLPDSSDISSFLQEPAKNPSIPMSMGMSMPPQQHGFPGYHGPRQMHPGMGGMNHPGMSMDNRMMGINPPMMTNQGMSGHHGYGQGGYPWPRPYH